MCSNQSLAEQQVLPFLSPAGLFSELVFFAEEVHRALQFARALFLGIVVCPIFAWSLGSNLEWGWGVGVGVESLSLPGQIWGLVKARCTFVAGDYSSLVFCLSRSFNYIRGQRLPVFSGLLNAEAME